MRIYRFAEPLISDTIKEEKIVRGTRMVSGTGVRKSIDDGGRHDVFI